MRVMVLGGYGVFGGRLSRFLLQAKHDVFITGRSRKKAYAFCDSFGGEPLVIDRADLIQLGAMLDRHEIDVLIDASGPFQDYEGAYDLARVALAAEVHYLDLSDDARFSAGIGELDEAALQIGRACLSGASTVPAISSAVVEELARDMDEITLIDTAVLPGNRAPRGRSVMQAILGQVGQPIPMWRGGFWRQVSGWSGGVEIDLPGGIRRRASYIGAPDLALFPAHFKARSVLFRAGLELGLMHGALAVFGWMARHRLLPRLDWFTGVFLILANLFKGFGTDRGGMQVRVAGRDRQGRAVTRLWQLAIGGGNGPRIPAIPAALLVDQIAQGRLDPGARPVLGDIPLADLEDALRGIGARIETHEASQGPLFEQVLGPLWAQMPDSFRKAHDLWDMHVLTGEASVTRGKGVLSAIIGTVFRFPKASDRVSVRVEMERNGAGEIWRRQFGQDRFVSYLSPSDRTPDGPARIFERFGAFTYELALPVAERAMQMQVTRGWLLGIPLPDWTLPVSQTREYDVEGRFHFDVSLSAPVAGFIVRYRGWLEPEV